MDYLPFNSEVSNLTNSGLSSQPNCFTASITCTAAIVLWPLSPAASCALSNNQIQNKINTNKKKKREKQVRVFLREIERKIILTRQLNN